MRKQITAVLMTTLLLTASCSTYSGLHSAETDELESTWFGYLNPGQVPTVNDVENFHRSYGRYPILTADQSRLMNVR